MPMPPIKTSGMIRRIISDSALGPVRVTRNALSFHGEMPKLRWDYAKLKCSNQTRALINCAFCVQFGGNVRTSDDMKRLACSLHCICQRPL